MFNIEEVFNALGERFDVRPLDQEHWTTYVLSSEPLALITQAMGEVAQKFGLVACVLAGKEADHGNMLKVQFRWPLQS